MRKQKSQHKKPLKKKIAVLGDGRTEQFYLKHLKRLKGFTYAVKPNLFDNLSLSDATKQIKKLLKNGYHTVFFLTDFDTVVNDEQQEAFDQFKKEFKDKPEVVICETMPSIEFWFLLHFVITTREFRNAAEAEKELKKFMPDFVKHIDFLEQEHWVRKLLEEGNEQEAIERAIQLLNVRENAQVGSHFPFSKVHVLLLSLINNVK